MMINKITNFLWIFMAVMPIFVNAQKNSLAGVSIPSKYTFNSENFVLNGSTIREKFFMDLYVGSLYLPSKSKDAYAIINSNSPTAFRLKIVSRLISADKFNTVIKESFKKVEGEFGKADAELKQLTTIIKEIKKGDEFYMVYIPDQGTNIVRNGKVIGTIPGIKFKRCLFATWLSKNSVSPKFTKEIIDGN